MKRILIASIFLLLSFTSANAMDQKKWCDGYKNGYETGYKQSRKTNMKPLIPMCPLAPMKSISDIQSDFELGYLRGLQDGFKK